MAQEVIQPSQVLEGAWEENAGHAEHLAGKHVRLEVFERDTSGPEAAGRPFHTIATPAERARA
jgi:hypothetical protein